MNRIKLSLLPAALALAGICTDAQAQVQTWNFSYTGFYYSAQVAPWDPEPPAGFRPDLHVGGSFSAEDLNHDGIIRHDELIALNMLGMDFRACEAQSNEYWQCGVGQNFTFNMADKRLTMDAGMTGHDPEWYMFNQSGFGTAGGYYRYESNPAFSIRETWQPTAQTQMWIAAVPEPETYALMGLGLAALAFVARRRKAV